MELTEVGGAEKPSHGFSCDLLDILTVIFMFSIVTTITMDILVWLSITLFYMYCLNLGFLITNISNYLSTRVLKLMFKVHVHY